MKSERSKAAAPIIPGSTTGTQMPTRSGMERGTFFRQSGWMASAAILGGLFNTASNFVAQRMPEAGQFNIFNTALSALSILGIPALGMQTVFAAQAAGSESESGR